jgi:hypothetical protein
MAAAFTLDHIVVVSRDRALSAMGAVLLRVRGFLIEGRPDLVSLSLSGCRSCGRERLEYGSRCQSPAVARSGRRSWSPGSPGAPRRRPLPLCL